jgi:hypothetical protein
MATKNDNPKVRGTNIQWYIAVRANCALDQSTNDTSMFSIVLLFFRCRKLFNYILAALFVAAEILFQDVRKEKNLHNSKHYEELKQNYSPKRLSQLHIPKSIVVEPEYSHQDVAST